jgi:hypothetical protein
MMSLGLRTLIVTCEAMKGKVPRIDPMFWHA